jgi:hypothetical protein
MKNLRPSRVLGAILAIVSMLFMQLVLAGYVCPQTDGSRLAPAPAAVAVSGAAVSMPDCVDTDVTQPTLCQASAHTVHQSLDKHELPSLQPFVPADLILILVSTSLPKSSSALALDTVRQSGAPPTPLAIRHCCFRI